MFLIFFGPLIVVIKESSCIHEFTVTCNGLLELSIDIKIFDYIKYKK